MTEVTIQNDIDYLFLQWLGMDYNFWNVLFADVVLLVATFVIVLIVGFIFICIEAMLE